MTDPAAFAAIAGLILVFAGFVKGVIGLGLPAIGVGLLSLMVTPAEAAALLILPNLVTNFWQMIAGGHLRGLARRMWPLLAGIAVGTVLGAAWLSSGPAGWATGLLGGALLAYAALGFAKRSPRVPPGAEAPVGVAAGIATGAVTVATGVFVMPAVPFLHALGLDRDRLVQALGLSFFASSVALAAALTSAGILDAASGLSSLAAMAPVLLGMMAGQRIRAKVSQQAFRRWFFLGLVGLGSYLVLRALG